jgi:hypothetical protein
MDILGGFSSICWCFVDRPTRLVCGVSGSRTCRLGMTAPRLSWWWWWWGISLARLRRCVVVDDNWFVMTVGMSTMFVLF